MSTKSFNEMFLVFLVLDFFLKCVGGFQIPNEVTVLDLSWTYDNNTLVWPGVQPFHFVKEASAGVGEDWYAVKEFCMGEHAGTHLDAPYHFYEKGLKTTEIDPRNFIVPGAMVDVSNLVGENRSFVLEPSHLEAWETENGPFPNNSVVLVRFGWSRFWTNAQDYFGFQPDKSLAFPSLSGSAASWIVNKKTILGVGVDVASLDVGYSKDYAVHKILAQNNLYSLENVALNQQIPVRNFTVIVAPMKIGSGTGGPCRIFALV